MTRYQKEKVNENYKRRKSTQFLCLIKLIKMLYLLISMSRYCERCIAEYSEELKTKYKIWNILQTIGINTVLIVK